MIQQIKEPLFVFERLEDEKGVFHLYADHHFAAIVENYLVFTTEYILWLFPEDKKVIDALEVGSLIKLYISNRIGGKMLKKDPSFTALYEVFSIVGDKFTIKCKEH